ncbi:MAG: DUF6194 family protein, partial [Micromonosporaceae bacterium]
TSPPGQRSSVPGRAANHETPATDETDPGTDDVVFPHPVYGELGWLCVVNPGPDTTTAIRDLLRTAYQLGRTRHLRRSGSH